MIISNKSKHHFWSQLLLGMLAIFVLPAGQELNYPSSIGNENYQNAQHQNAPQILTAVALLQQTRQQQRQPQHALPAVEIHPQNQPHFARSPFIANAPIRAGPAFI
ncbi:secA translation cis-regulator SecM [Aggregatibacter kilianii]|uniref:secA translation cis-regulator SecM n=1 Tax=Aggregatibacter kilianii TaxID=2025884 RepID=UPI000D650F48|nr:secA translation cis-regulator SecM [Aggregatibacter kilianii]